MAKFEVHVTGTSHLNNISDNSTVPQNIYPHPTPEGLVEISVRWGGGVVNGQKHLEQKRT